MIVAITGASGHIGNCLVRELIKQGARVKVLVHHFRNDLDQMNVELIQGNLLEPESLLPLCEGADVVFHLAAQIAIDNRNPELVYATNVTGTKNMIRSAQSGGVKKFIHFSSIDAFQTGSSDRLLNENRVLIETTQSIYGFSKAESEREVLKAVNEGLNAVILSPTAVIGPFDYRGSLLGRAILQLSRNQLPFLVSGGYNWVDVRDVVSASIQAMESGRKGEKYILSGNYLSLNGLSKLISKISGSKIPVLVPMVLARLTCPFFQAYAAMTGKDPLYTSHSLDLLESAPENISYEKARVELDYQPRPLEETLIDTLKWYDENK
jgi:dihydroflavonol-4-reductase